MNSRNTEPAFPQWSERRQPGMTLREFFAVIALQGLLASGRGEKVAENIPGDSARILCRAAFVYADALLAERDRST